MSITENMKCTRQETLNCYLTAFREDDGGCSNNSQYMPTLPSSHASYQQLTTSHVQHKPTKSILSFKIINCKNDNKKPVNILSSADQYRAAAAVTDATAALVAAAAAAK